MQEIDTAAWDAWFANPCNATRNVIVEHHLPQVTSLAKQIKSSELATASSVDISDLVSSGSIGLINAVEQFDPSRGVPFRKFVARKIAQAIFDDLRQSKIDGEPRRARRIRQHVARSQDAFEQRHGRVPTPEELTAETGIEYQRVTAALTHGSVGGETAMQGVEAMTPDGALDAAEIRAYLIAAMARLTPRDRLVLTLVYRSPVSRSEIARMFGVSPQMMTKLVNRALARLRREVRYVATHGQHFHCIDAASVAAA